MDVKVFWASHKKCMVLNGMFILLCYAHMAFSDNIGVDTEILLSNEPAMLDSWIGIGRQGLVLTKYLFGLAPYNPYFAGVLFLAAFTALGASIAFFCWVAGGKNDLYPYWMFLLLFSTCPVWMPQFYFALQRTEVVFGLIYAVVSAFSLCQMVFYGKKKVSRVLVYLFFGIWSFCSYQGCVMFYIGLCIIFFLMDFIRLSRGREWRVYAALILKLMGGFLLVYCLNMAITNLFFGQGQYLQEQVGWGRIEPMESLRKIASHVYHITTNIEVGQISAFPLSCICTAIVFIHFCRKKEMEKSLKAVLLIALAGLLITPFLLTIYLGDLPVARSQFVLQLIAAFSCMFACGIWRAKGGTKEEWFQRGAVGFSAVFIWLSLGMVFRLQYTADVSYQEDVRVVCEIAKEIRQTEGAEGMPVIFVGKYKAKLNRAAVPMDMYGESLLGWGSTKEDPTGATGRIISLMDALGINMESGVPPFGKEAVLAAESMEPYPNQGYISVQDGYVVVNLSMLEYNP